MKYERTPAFVDDWQALSEVDKSTFRSVVFERFVPACEQRVANPGLAWPAGLRVKPVRDADGVLEMTWSFRNPDGRATFGWVDADNVDWNQFVSVGRERHLDLRAIAELDRLGLECALDDVEVRDEVRLANGSDEEAAARRLLHRLPVTEEALEVFGYAVPGGVLEWQHRLAADGDRHGDYAGADSLDDLDRVELAGEEGAGLVERRDVLAKDCRTWDRGDEGDDRDGDRQE